MATQDSIPTDLTPEEYTAGFRLRWIRNPARGRADAPERLRAVVYVFRNHFRLVKHYDLNLSATYYNLEVYGVYAPQQGFCRPNPDETPEWHRIKYPQEYRLASPSVVTEHVAAWIDQHPDQEYAPHHAPELPLAE